MCPTDCLCYTRCRTSRNVSFKKKCAGLQDQQRSVDSAPDHPAPFLLIHAPAACCRTPPALQPSAPDVPTAVPLTAVGARLDNRYKPEQVCARAGWLHHKQRRRARHCASASNPHWHAAAAANAQIAAWQQHATGEFEELWLEGLGHNFVQDAPQQLMDALRRQLAQPAAAAAAAQP